MLERDVEKRWSAQYLEDIWFVELLDKKPEVDFQVIGNLENLRNFRANQKLQRAVVMFIAN